MFNVINKIDIDSWLYCCFITAERPVRLHANLGTYHSIDFGPNSWSFWIFLEFLSHCAPPPPRSFLLPQLSSLTHNSPTQLLACLLACKRALELGATTKTQSLLVLQEGSKTRGPRHLQGLCTMPPHRGRRQLHTSSSALRKQAQCSTTGSRTHCYCCCCCL